MDEVMNDLGWHEKQRINDVGRHKRRKEIFSWSLYVKDDTTYAFWLKFVIIYPSLGIITCQKFDEELLNVRMVFLENRDNCLALLNNINDLRIYPLWGLSTLGLCHLSNAIAL